jgi:hypothetical protein
MGDGCTCRPIDVHCATSQGATPMVDHESRDSARPSSRRPSPAGSELSLSEEAGGGEEGRCAVAPPLSFFLRLLLLLGREVVWGKASARLAEESWPSVDLLLRLLPDRGIRSFQIGSTARTLKLLQAARVTAAWRGGGGGNRALPLHSHTENLRHLMYRNDGLFKYHKTKFLARPPFGRGNMDTWPSG